MGDGYLLILLGAVMLSAMAAVRKEYQRRAGATLFSTLLFMCVSSLFITLIGAVYALATDLALIRNADGTVLGLAAIFAIVLTVNTCLCIFGAKYGSLAVLMTFATLGTLVISSLYGLIFYPEENALTVYRVAGLLLSAVIIILGFIGDKRADGEEKKAGRTQRIFILICIGVFLFNGSALSIYSMFTEHRAEYGGFNFIFLYSFFCVLLCLIGLAAILLFRGRERGGEECRSGLRIAPVICAVGYGVIFTVNEFCALTATSILPIVIQAPLSFAVNLVVVAVADYFIYRQRLTRMQVIQVALAILSGVCFAL